MSIKSLFKLSDKWNDDKFIYNLLNEYPRFIDIIPKDKYRKFSYLSKFYHPPSNAKNIKYERLYNYVFNKEMVATINIINSVINQLKTIECSYGFENFYKGRHFFTVRIMLFINNLDKINKIINENIQDGYKIFLYIKPEYYNRYFGDGLVNFDIKEL